MVSALDEVTSVLFTRIVVTSVLFELATTTVKLYFAVEPDSDVIAMEIVFDPLCRPVVPVTATEAFALLARATTVTEVVP